MKQKLKKILIPFFLMLAFIAITESLDILMDFGIFTPHVGMLFVFGILFGPYGAIGSVMANIISDVYNGYNPIMIICSEIISFAISCLAYKLWYSSYRGHEITKPKLDTTFHLGLFLSIMLICGTIYAVFHGEIFHLIYKSPLEYIMQVYLISFVNIAFVFGILHIWVSKKIDFIHTPKTLKKQFNKKLYTALLISLITVTVITTASYFLKLNNSIIIGELILLAILLFAYLTKPVQYSETESEGDSVVEKIMTMFLLTTLFIVVLGILQSFIPEARHIVNIDYIDNFLPAMPVIAFADIITILFFIPGFNIILYVEKKVINPIKSFSEIEDFITENKKIEAEGLVNLYSEYINETDEIGKLARSYTDLIKHNNSYIENIHEIEGEKERIKAELDIATKIQASNLPTKAIENENYIVAGYSKPAKEVGGDFFDYYHLDDGRLVIVIGDASGKGVPAALLATITQVMIKQILQHNQDPSKVLYSLNNQICETNSETMFITLWVGIYDRNTGKITFSNAGHNPPIIKDNDGYKYLKINTGIVLGIMEDFEFTNEEVTFSEEIILYTDGITDANNTQQEMYGEDRLLNFFNRHGADKNPIAPLLKDIDEFTDGEEQFDDMTLVYLKDKS